MAQIKRLVTFGCSLTYGHGLADCYIEDGRAGPRPSVQAWPFLVAKHFKLAIENQGIPGASNKEIFNHLRNFKFQKGDAVIILWSFINRHCTIYPDYIDRYGPWLSSTRSKTWVKYLFNDHDATIETMRYAEHAELYLKSIKIKNCTYFSDHNTDANIPEGKLFHRLFKDFGRDGKHPGRQSHIDFANQIIKDPTGPAVWFT
jgi:hypothetical protein